MPVKFRRTYTCDPALEVSGPTTRSFVDNIESPSFQPLIEVHGLHEVDDEQWYPVSQVFALFNDIVAQNSGNTQPFVGMGMRIAEQSTFPPELEGSITLPMMLDGWQDHYEANHRGADLPPVTTIQVDDTHYQLELRPDHLYPFNLVYGMAYGFCRLLLPPKTKFTVKYDDIHTPYVENPGEKIVIDIMWES